ncbi:MAG TPA: alpha/beta hydrolase, partial [Hyphomonadaceae bacterium]|nr:alpha/beta hydrolase [Hyphomonadaceae bacterium]
ACAFPVDESYFFKPVPVAQKATDPSQMRLADEERIADPAKLNRALIDVFPNLAERLPAKVTHQFVEIAGQRIALTRVKAANGGETEPLLVFCAGQSGGRTTRGALYAAKLLTWGEAIVFDYPGYGDSTGEPTLEAMTAFEKAFPAWLDAQAKNRPLILWGHSMGGLICPQIAAGSREVDALVLETTAPNAADLAETRKPWFAPVTLKLKEGLVYDTPAALAGFKGPVLVLGAGKDTVIPVRLARSLYEQLKANGVDVTYLEYSNTHHQNTALNHTFAKDGAAFFAKVSDRK